MPVFGVILVRISPYSVRMRENADQNNSEYGHLLLSDSYWKLLFLAEALPISHQFSSKSHDWL